MEIIVIGLLGIIAAALLFGGAAVISVFASVGTFVVGVVWLGLLGGLIYWLSGHLTTLAIFVPIAAVAALVSSAIADKLEDRRRERAGMLPRSRR